MDLFSAPAQVPVPLRPPQGDAFRVDGELIAYEVTPGRTITLRFHEAYEAFLYLDGTRVLRHEDLDQRNVSLWAHRRLLPLWRALGDRLGLAASLTRRGVLVEDLIDLASGDALDHPRLRRELAECDVWIPSFAVLGAPANRAELATRLRGIFAAGTRVEVRDEDGGRVLQRWRLVVGQEL